jgi:ergothioneine biosynthesis protein EgtB
MADLLKRYRGVRARSAEIAAPLALEDQVVQSMADASPTRWHLAHTTWFFETFVLEPRPGFAPFHPQFRVLFNSYYNGVGERFPRPRRGTQSRPTVAEVNAYRAHVDERMIEILSDLNEETSRVVEVGLNHEEQHQELMLTDLKHAFGTNPLLPVYRERQIPEAGPPSGGWSRFEGGVIEIGHEGSAFAFDNETPRHRVFLAPFQLADDLVTNADYLAFMNDDGYARHDLWLDEGWAWIQRDALEAPLYWRNTDEGWRVFTLHGEIDVDPNAPACHLSFYEADAYARWAGKRLPTEAEWEHAAQADTAGQRLDDVTADALHPTTGAGLLGNVWQHTATAYRPYPGYTPPAGAIGEYNGKFMSGQMVLRGASCFTPRGHARATYRNFFHPDKRWQLTGARLAEDL